MDKSLSNSKQKVETKQVDLDTGMPDLPKKELFAITFAFLGINMAFFTTEFPDESYLSNNWGQS